MRWKAIIERNRYWDSVSQELIPSTSLGGRLFRSRKTTAHSYALKVADKSVRATRELRSFYGYGLNDHIFVGAVLTVAGDFRDFFHDVVSFDHLAENGVLARQPFRVSYRDEELRAIGVGAGVGHGQFSCLVETVG